MLGVDTWGVSVQHFGIMQRTGWTNKAFHKALAQPQSAAGKTYNTLSRSWVDQLSWGIDWALAALPATHPLRVAVEADFRDMQVYSVSGPKPATEGFHELPAAKWKEQIRTVGGSKVTLDERGAIVSLIDRTGVQWADGPLALLRYQSVTDSQFEHEMRDSYLMQHNQSGDAVSGSNEYGKPSQDQVAHPLAQLVAPTLKSVWQKGPKEAAELWLEMVFSKQLHTDYGCPSSAWLRLSFGARSTNLTLELYNKTATRLGEAGWFTFAPRVTSFEVDKLGDWTNPLDVVEGGAKSLHGLTDGVRATLEAKRRLYVRSLDSGVVRFDAPMPVPTPIFRQPDIAQGMSFGLFMNTWCGHTAPLPTTTQQPSTYAVRSCISQEHQLRILVALRRGAGSDCSHDRLFEIPL